MRGLSLSFKIFNYVIRMVVDSGKCVVLNVYEDVACALFSVEALS